MNRVGRLSQANRGNDSVTIHTATIFIYYILVNNIYLMYFCMYYITIKVGSSLWSWNYTHFQFNIYYNSILCLYMLIPWVTGQNGSGQNGTDKMVWTIPCGSSCLHEGGSICLVPPDPFYRYFRSGGSIYWYPRTTLGGPNPT